MKNINRTKNENPILKYNGKVRKINYTRKEFIKEYNISQSFFNNNIEGIMSSYKLDKACIKSDYEDNANYDIKYEIAPLLALFFNQKMNHGLNPLNDARHQDKKPNASEFIEYNNNLINNISTLPDYLRLTINNHYFYKSNFELIKYMPLLLEKISLAFSIMIHETYLTNGNIILDFIKNLDAWIYKYLKNFLHTRKETDSLKIIEEALNDDLGDIYLTSKKIYNLDYLLSETFKKIISQDISSLTPKIQLNLKESIEDNKKTTPKDLESIRSSYLEELNLSFYQEKIDNVLSRHEKSVEYNVDNFSSKLNNIKKEKNNLIRIYKTYIIHILNKDIDIDNVNLTLPYELDLIDMRKYINIENLNPNNDKAISEVALRMYEEIVKIHTDLDSIKQELTNSKLSNAVKGSLDSALGEMLYLLFSIK